MKKLLKILAVLFLTGVVLAAGGLVALKMWLSQEKIKQLAQDYARTNLHRELTFSDASFNWIGITLNDFALSEDSTFENGTFIKANQLVAKIAVKPLLKKSIEIDTLQLDGLDVKITKREDSSFNFDSLLAPSDETAAKEASVNETSDTVPNGNTQKGFSVTANEVSVSNCALLYEDKTTAFKTTVNNLDINIHNFDLDNPFTADIRFTTQIDQQGQPSVTLPVQIELTAFLAGLDNTKASVTLNKLDASYKTIRLTANGKMDNFTAPKINLQGDISGLTNKVLTDFDSNLPSFSLPTLSLHVTADTNLDDSTLDLKEGTLTLLDNALTLNGNVGWGGENVTYNLQGKLNTNLAQLIQMTDTVKDFQPAGKINGSFKTSDKNNGKDFSGSFTFQNASLFYDPFTLTGLNGTIVLASLDNISSKSLTGQLNQADFTSSFAYKTVKNVTDLVLNLKLDALTLDKFSSSQEETTGSSSNENTTAQPANTTVRKTEDFTNLTANITIGKINIPYFRSDGLALTAALTNLSNSMQQANGNIAFTLQPGAITNLDSFIKENKIVKIIFLPLSLVRKVSTVLKLNLFPSDTDKGSIALSEGSGSYTFTNGIMNVDKTLFKTTISDLSATGTVNFVTDELNMKATATLLTQAAPVVIKITGTTAEPKGKLDVVNTIGAVVGGILTGKSEKGVAQEGEAAAKDTLTDAANTIKQIGGLFKKKSSK